MSAILPIGDVLPVDAEGYLVNPSRYELIVPPWSDVVATVKAAYLQHVGAKMHSLYIRGSVAKGTAISGVSDIDTFAVVRGDAQAIDRSWIAVFQQRMAVQYPFQTGIETGFVSHHSICDPNGTRGGRFTIKSQSVCIWGEDLAPLIPRFKPGRDLASHAPGIHEDLREVMELLPAMRDEQIVGAWCQWTMKRLVRTGFELVMEEERTYTRDLYPCYRAFSRHFPDQEPQMKQALEWAIEPSGNKEDVARFLNAFGVWIVNAVTEAFAGGGAKSQ